jgi:hypothetical protein
MPSDTIPWESVKLVALWVAVAAAGLAAILTIAKHPKVAYTLVVIGAALGFCAGAEKGKTDDWNKHSLPPEER